jgi:hypothetical protein
MKWIDDDPTLLLGNIDKEHVPTVPLTPGQFNEVIAAT